MSMFIVLGDDVAMRAAIALLKSTQPKVTLPRAALAAPAQPVDPASLMGPCENLEAKGVTLSGRDEQSPLPAALVR
jgi:hypothetical protein